MKTPFRSQTLGGIYSLFFAFPSETVVLTVNCIFDKKCIEVEPIDPAHQTQLLTAFWFEKQINRVNNGRVSLNNIPR